MNQLNVCQCCCSCSSNFFLSLSLTDHLKTSDLCGDAFWRSKEIVNTHSSFQFFIFLFLIFIYTYSVGCVVGVDAGCYFNSFSVWADMLFSLFFTSFHSILILSFCWNTQHTCRTLELLSGGSISLFSFLNMFVICCPLFASTHEFKVYKWNEQEKKMQRKNAHVNRWRKLSSIESFWISFRFFFFNLFFRSIWFSSFSFSIRTFFSNSIFASQSFKNAVFFLSWTMLTMRKCWSEEN